MKRQQSLKEKLMRQYSKEKRKLINKCEELGIAYYEIGKNDSELYANPNNFVCIFSENEMHVGQTFTKDIEEPEIFISAHDYETFDLS